MSEHDPGLLRVSDADRHQVAELLRDAAAEGRLDLDELDERLTAAYGAKVVADLVPLTVDLPLPDNLPAQLRSNPPMPIPNLTPAQSSGVPIARYSTSIAVMSGVERRGAWEVAETHNVFALMGGVDLDLREARFTSRETVINASTIWGGVDIYVNAYTRVIMDGFGIMGAFEQGRDKVPAELSADSPVVRVKGFALMGAVCVTRKQMPGEPGTVLRRITGH